MNRTDKRVLHAPQTLRVYIGFGIKLALLLFVLFEEYDKMILTYLFFMISSVFQFFHISGGFLIWLTVIFYVSLVILILAFAIAGYRSVSLRKVALALVAVVCIAEFISTVLWWGSILSLIFKICDLILIFMSIKAIIIESKGKSNIAPTAPDETGMSESQFKK